MPPAASESSRLSASARRASRILPAPTAARTANSRWRSATRASMRLVTFTHAISRKTATAPMSSQADARGVADPPVAQRLHAFQAARADGGQNARISGHWGASISSARSGVTSGLRRANAISRVGTGTRGSSGRN